MRPAHIKKASLVIKRTVGKENKRKRKKSESEKGIKEEIISEIKYKEGGENKTRKGKEGKGKGKKVEDGKDGRISIQTHNLELVDVNTIRRNKPPKVSDKTNEQILYRRELRKMIEEKYSLRADDIVSELEHIERGWSEVRRKGLDSVIEVQRMVDILLGSAIRTGDPDHDLPLAEQLSRVVGIMSSTIVNIHKSNLYPTPETEDTGPVFRMEIANPDDIKWDENKES